MSPEKRKALPPHVLLRMKLRSLQRAVRCRLNILRLLIFLPGLCLSQTLQAAVGFTISPTATSNTYNGIVTLQVTGLSSGQPVVVQKFLDANTNGVLDAPDILWQQFRLTDGQATVIGGVTNIIVPGDNDPVAGQITSRF